MTSMLDLLLERLRIADAILVRVDATQGSVPPSRKFINVREREKLFDDAIKTVNKDMPLDVVLLPISVDADTTHAAWAREMKLPFPLVADTSLAVAERYGKSDRRALRTDRVRRSRRWRT